MTYELAKQLKDAGFAGARVQECFKEHDHFPVGKEHCEYLPNPTLSELIEACGKDIGSLTQEDDGRWYGVTKGFMVPTYGHGSTPEEAVAKLWLALNSKPQNENQPA